MSEGNKNQKKMANLSFSGQKKSLDDKIDEIRFLVEKNLRHTNSLKISEEKNKLDIELQKDLKKLLQDNLKISKELYIMTKKIKRWIVWQRAFGVIKILIILIPIILGIIYLPPLLKDYVKPIQEMYKQILDIDQVPIK